MRIRTIIIALVGAFLAWHELHKTGIVGAPFASPSSVPSDPAVERRFQVASLIAKGIKDGINDPASLVFDGLSTNADASIVCVEYRARNAFNGVVRKYLTVTGKSASESIDVWNKTCAGRHDMFDEKNAFAFL